VGIKFRVIIFSIKRPKRLREIMHVGKRQVHALCTGWWNNMGRVPCKEETTILKRLDNEAAHPSNALLQDSAFCRTPAVFAAESPAKLAPDAIIAPFRDILIGFALEVEPRDARGSHAVERKSAFVVHVDQLIAGGCGFRKDSKPCEWIGAIVNGEYPAWERLS